MTTDTRLLPRALWKELQFELVAQKDLIFRAIIEGHVDDALEMLFVCRPIWEATAYGYKGVEICSRVIDETQEKLSMTLPCDFFGEALRARLARAQEIARLYANAAGPGSDVEGS
jgi:hypothetical protein